MKGEPQRKNLFCYKLHRATVFCTANLVRRGLDKRGLTDDDVIDLLICGKLGQYVENIVLELRLELVEVCAL